MPQHTTTACCSASGDTNRDDNSSASNGDVEQRNCKRNSIVATYAGGYGSGDNDSSPDAAALNGGSRGAKCGTCGDCRACGGVPTGRTTQRPSTHSRVYPFLPETSRGVNDGFGRPGLAELRETSHGVNDGFGRPGLAELRETSYGVNDGFGKPGLAELLEFPHDANDGLGKAGLAVAVSRKFRPCASGGGFATEATPDWRL